MNTMPARMIRLPALWMLLLSGIVLPLWAAPPERPESHGAESLTVERHNAENDEDDPSFRTVFYPQIGYTPELGWLFGAAALIIYDPVGPPPESPVPPAGPGDAGGVEARARPDNTLLLAAFYTTTTAYRFAVENNQYLFRDRLLLESDLVFAEVPTDFFGIGSDAEDAEQYLERRLSGELGALFQFLPRFRVGPRFRATRHWVEDPDEGGLLDTGKISGSDGATVLLPMVEFRYDSRPTTFDPRSGAAFSLRLGHTLPDSAERYGSVAAEYVQITPFFGDHRIATQYVFEHVLDTAPFQELPRLGGPSLLRGLTEGRYRDRTLVAAQAEYRSPFLWRFSLEVFGGVGQVASEIDGLDGQDLVAAGGAGLRFQLDPESGFLLRFNAAYSEPEGAPQFYVGAGDAF